MSNFKAKMYQIRFRLRLSPRPGELPRPPSWISGVLLLGVDDFEGEGMEKNQREKGREGGE